MVIETMNSLYIFRQQRCSGSQRSFFSGLLCAFFFFCVQLLLVIADPIFLPPVHFFSFFFLFFCFSNFLLVTALNCICNEMHINTKFMKLDAIVIYTLAYPNSKEMIQEFNYYHFVQERYDCTGTYVCV